MKRWSVNPFVTEKDSGVRVADPKTLGRRGDLVAETKVFYVCCSCKRDTHTKWGKIREKSPEHRVCISCFAKSRRVAFREDAFDFLDSNTLYWIGYIAGDGNVTRPKKSQMKVSIKSIDDDILEKFSSFLGIPGRKSGNIVWVYSNKIASQLLELGITERKSTTIKIRHDISQSADFWRGLVDSDGTVALSAYDGRKNVYPMVVYGSGSIDLITQYVDWCESLTGRRQTIYEDMRPNNHIYKVRFMGTLAVVILKTLYGSCDSSVSLDRKRNKALEYIDMHERKYA